MTYSHKAWSTPSMMKPGIMNYELLSGHNPTCTGNAVHIDEQAIGSHFDGSVWR